MTREINVPLLRKVLEHVAAHPERHEQQRWTRVRAVDRNRCERVQFPRGVDVAWASDADHNGRAVRTIHVLPESDVWTCRTTACLAGWTAHFEGWRPVYAEDGMVYRDGVVRHARRVAATALGLDTRDSLWLFAASHTIDDLWRIAWSLTDGEVQPPSGLIDSPEEVR